MELNCELENDVYNIPLTLKTYIPENWEIVHLVNENGETSNLTPMLDEEGKHVLYSLLPNSGKFMLIKGS